MFSATHKYLPAVLIIGTVSLMELIITPLIPNFIVVLILLFLGFITAIIGLVFAAKLDFDYVNRKLLIIIFSGILVWIFGSVLEYIPLMINFKKSGIASIAFTVSSIFVWLVGHLMIIIAGFKLKAQTLPQVPSAGKVAKNLVLIPFTVLFGLGVIRTIILCIHYANGRLFFVVQFTNIANLIVSSITSILIFVGLIVGIVRYIRESREMELPKHQAVVFVNQNFV